jgi:hypothetical protein
MTSIAIIAEGITDQVVLENLLIGIANDPNIDIRMVQPTLDVTDATRNAGAGGWTEVFRFCKSDLFANTFSTNQFVVVQIDTDTCCEIGYDIPIPRQGNDVDVPQLILDVCERICKEIDATVLSQIRTKLIFAICVDSVECWLLPLLSSQPAQARKTTGCLAAVNLALNKSGAGYYLDAKKPEYYKKLSEPYKRRKTVDNNYKKNPSLQVFVEAVAHTLGV